MQIEVKLRSANEVVEAVLKSDKLRYAVINFVVDLRKGHDTGNASILVLSVLSSETSRFSQEILNEIKKEPPVDEL